MAWPTTKASNQYTDSGQDRIADARAEINQNITNVNDIIDTFDISSPTNGDLLIYNSTSGAWEPQTVSSTVPESGSDFIFFEDNTYTTPNLLVVTGHIDFYNITVSGSNWTHNSTGDYAIIMRFNTRGTGTGYFTIGGSKIDGGTAGSATGDINTNGTNWEEQQQIAFKEYTVTSTATSYGVNLALSGGDTKTVMTFATIIKK